MSYHGTSTSRAAVAETYHEVGVQTEGAVEGGVESNSDLGIGITSGTGDGAPHAISFSSASV